MIERCRFDCFDGLLRKRWVCVEVAIETALIPLVVF
jgi:hypothetical protein